MSAGGRPAGPPPALLASVRTAREALRAAAGGADLIDLKEPRAGALGALPLPTVRAIVALLRARWPALPVSATVGDPPADGGDALDAWLAPRVAAVAATGVDYVKVGIAPGPRAAARLERLAAMPGRCVPVLLVDDGLDPAVLAHACALRFAVVMLDTADKRGRTLFDCVDAAALRAFVQAARARGVRCGLAGSLRADQLPMLVALRPDIVGFRAALCATDRRGSLDPRRLTALRAALSAAAQPAVADASSSSRIRARSPRPSRSTG